LNKIHKLPEELVNQIAAGEVVERPSSILKELVENAIDAQATDIRVHITNGGIDEIIVQDDGIGMGYHDAKMAVKSHTTSKISTMEDLSKIVSMGFRGEALASIHSVSHLTIATKTADSSDGLKLSYEKGLLVQELAWQQKTGTTINVSHLFENIPARKRFLRKPRTEFAYCQEVLQSLLLAHPDIAMCFWHNKKEIFNIPKIKQEKASCLWGKGILLKRIQSLFSNKHFEQLLYVQEKNTYAQIEALISPPGFEFSHSHYIYTYVNGRFVKDKLLRQAVIRGYHSHLLKGRYPSVFLYFYSDPSLIDVNTHPAKTELRFEYPKEIQGLITQSIRRMLRQGTWAVPVLSKEPSLPQASQPIDINFDLHTRGSSGYVFTKDASKSSVNDIPEETIFIPKEKVMRFGIESPSTPAQKSFVLPEQGRQEANLGFSESRKNHLWEKMDYLGNFARCYLFFAHGDELLVVDQHAFHERIIFERLIKNQKIMFSHQKLLIPEVLVLPPVLLDALVSKTEVLKTIGFSVKMIDERTLECRSFPVFLQKARLEDLLIKLAKQLLSDKASLSEISHDVLATIACHSAVRAGDELQAEQVLELMKEADTVDFYHNCPHGRPVFKVWNREEIARWFHRL